MLDPQISFSGRVSRLSRQYCEDKLWQLYIDIPYVSKVLCHISDRAVEYSGAILVQLTNGKQLSAHTISDSPTHVMDNLVFIIELQRKNEKEVEPQFKAASKDTVMIVDDDPESVVVLQKILDKLNQPSIYVSDAYEAIEKVIQDQYKLIIMDIVMPQLSGLHVIAYADSELEQKMIQENEKMRNFVTFSGNEEQKIKEVNFDKFNYMGHWTKQKKYNDLMGTVSKTLLDIEMKNAH